MSCLVIRNQFLGVNADLERLTSGSEGAGCERLNWITATTGRWSEVLRGSSGRVVAYSILGRRVWWHMM